MRYVAVILEFLFLLEALQFAILCRNSELEMWSLDQIVWTFFFALILIISILGNCIVLWIILGIYHELS